MKFIAHDFEYKDTKQPRLTLVSCALADDKGETSIWLFKDRIRQAKLKQYFLQRRDSHILLSFNVDAEARGLIALGLNPIKFKWIDLQAEWKMLTNHNDLLGYGKHFFDGRYKVTHRRAYGDYADKRPHDKTPVNLLAVTAKLIGGVTEEDYLLKQKMRDMILHNKDYTLEQQAQILSYGAGDIKDLVAIYHAQIKEYFKLLDKKNMELLHEEQLYRGNTVARAALIASTGYPVNRKKVTKFTQNIPNIIKDIQEDINAQFPEMEVFYWNKKENRYSLNTKAVKAWIDKSIYKNLWDKTPTESYSLSLDSWERHFSFRHDFPRDNFPAQFLRYKKVEKSLNGFKPKSVTAKNKETFFSYYGDDDRAHPYLNAYGAQSARYQPKALGFIHLKAAWMRALVEPRPGRAIASIDYGSEEFLISALLSGDKNMLEAYRSGDVYLYFAKLAGAVPWDGTKAQYKKERDAFKATTLGISYGMGAGALARKLCADTGEDYDFSDAMNLINQFGEAYPDYQAWIKDNEFSYIEKDHVKLPCGWYMFGDNDNIRSVNNMPVQGVGSSILRKAIEFCQDAGLTVILPLHDALYIEYNAGDYAALDTFHLCMREAFAYYFPNTDARELIRLDLDTWSPDYKDIVSVKTPGGLDVNPQELYIDERSKSEFKQFSKYFL